MGVSKIINKEGKRYAEQIYDIFRNSDCLYIHLYLFIFMIKEVKKYGTSGHIILPKRYIGIKVNVLLPEEPDVYLTKKEIEKLIEDKILEAKSGY